MARMYPRAIEKISAPYSEEEVYRALEKLNDTYIVFHSVQWLKRTLDKSFTWYENDFLILSKKYGILILEVKGGRIYFQDGIFHQVNLDTGEDKELDEGNDPLSQAKRGIYHFRKILERKIRGISSRISIQPCIWLPATDVSKAGPLPLLYEESRKAILDVNSLKQPVKALGDVFDYYGAEQNTNITDEEFDIIRDTIAPDFDLIPSPSIIKSELDSLFLKLTREQAGLLDYLQEQRVATIQGAAGTGKTLIALEASRRFASEGKKVLFLCFNRYLYEHLKFDCPIEGVDFYNINAFVGQYSNLDISVPKVRASELQKIDIDKFDYEAVVIDEAQDFEDEEIQFLSDMCELKGASFYTFFDKNQLLTTNKVPDWIMKSECRLVLTKNCRNTYEIACTSYTVIDVPIKAKIGVVKGAQPTVTFSHKNDVLTIGKLIKYFKDDDNGYKDSEITILSLVSEEKSIMNGINKIDGITISRTRNNSSVFYTTAKKFKGLESKVIIITDVDESSFNDDSQKRVFYVACSRATHRLALYIAGTDEEIKRIGSSIQDLKFSPKGNIMTKTRTINFDVGK